jgi:hypothetical protein
MYSMQIADFLAAWTVEFIKHMDSFTRSILDIRREGDVILVKHKAKEQAYFIKPELDSNFSGVLQSSKDRHVAIMTLNTKSNLDKLLKNWSTVSQTPYLKVFFINPLSENERKWVICPYTHNKVSDDDALRLGLESLFLTVDPVTDEHLKKMRVDAA